MALKRKKKTSTSKKSATPKPKRKLSEKQRLLLGGFFMILGIAIFISILSFYFSWQSDQSELGLFKRGIERKNLLKTFGAHIGNFLVYNGVGLMSFAFPILFFLTGISYFFGIGKAKLRSRWFWGLYLVIVGAVTLGFFNHFYGLLSGVVGFEINDFLQDYICLLYTSPSPRDA